MRPPAGLASHGGAGPARPDGTDGASRWARRSAGLAEALRAGLAVLAGGGAAPEAVVAAVVVLEDDEEWNAGRGSALTTAGTVEMDAAVADGWGRRLGGVACVTAVRHPVEAARAVMDDGRHVLLAGPGAVAFARAAGLAFEPEAWFVTDRRRRDLALRASPGTCSWPPPRVRSSDPNRANRPRRPGLPPQPEGSPHTMEVWECGPTASSTRVGRTPPASPSASATSTSPPRLPGAAPRTAPP